MRGFCAIYRVHVFRSYNATPVCLLAGNDYQLPLQSVVTHRGDPAAWCAGSGGKYRELVLEGNQGRLKKRVASGWSARSEREQFPSQKLW